MCWPEASDRWAVNSGTINSSRWIRLIEATQEMTVYFTSTWLETHKYVKRNKTYSSRIRMLNSIWTYSQGLGFNGNLLNGISPKGSSKSSTSSSRYASAVPWEKGKTMETTTKINVKENKLCTEKKKAQTHNTLKHRDGKRFPGKWFSIAPSHVLNRFISHKRTGCDYTPQACMLLSSPVVSPR